MAKEPSGNDQSPIKQDEEMSQLKSTIEKMKKSFHSELQREAKKYRGAYHAQAKAWAYSQKNQSAAEADNLEKQMTGQLASKQGHCEHEALKHHYNQLGRQSEAENKADQVAFNEYSRSENSYSKRIWQAQDYSETIYMAPSLSTAIQPSI